MSEQAAKLVIKQIDQKSSEQEDKSQLESLTQMPIISFKEAQMVYENKTVTANGPPDIYSGLDSF